MVTGQVAFGFRVTPAQPFSVIENSPACGPASATAAMATGTSPMLRTVAFFAAAGAPISAGPRSSRVGATPSPVRRSLTLTVARAISPDAPVATTSALRSPPVFGLAVIVNGQVVPGASVTPRQLADWMAKSFVAPVNPKPVIRAGPEPVLRTTSDAGATVSSGVTEPKSTPPGSMAIWLRVPVPWSGPG